MITTFVCHLTCCCCGVQLLTYQAYAGSLGTNYWDWLAAESKLQVLSLLSLKDLAKAARTCKELAAHIRDMRAGLEHLIIPEGKQFRPPLQSGLALCRQSSSPLNHACCYLQNDWVFGAGIGAA